ncbi:MAG: T9SS type A sorting domain-containing protein, partial [Calditrichaeota bacterium]|nr:T9SS type A sorting domain-containing protein [Calditrichota bacterium]
SKWKRVWRSAVIAHVASSRSSGGSSSGRRARAVMYLPPCFDINKNSAMVESVLFDSLAFGESLMLDSIPNYRPFDLVITDATDYLDTLAVLDSITIGLGTPLAMVVAGVDDPGAYAPNPEGISTAIRLMSVPIPGDSANPADVQIVFANAVTDAPKVSIALQNGATLVDGISFGGAAEPVNLPPDNYTVEVRDSLTQQVITTFAMDLQNSAGKVLTKVLQGFVDPSANQNGAPLELGTVDAGTTIVTAIEDDVQPPVAQQFELLQNYPNPFNPTTRIDFRLPKQAHVKLDVFNVLGQQVATLVDGQLTAGTHSATFDASQHASGLYFYRLKADNEISKVRKMMLLK